MNQLINELYGKIAKDGRRPRSMTEQEVEAFAKLIIEECLDVHACVTTDHFTPDGVLEEVERLIKRKFGV